MDLRHTAVAALVGGTVALGTLYGIALWRVLTGPPINFDLGDDLGDDTDDDDDDETARQLIERAFHPTGGDHRQGRHR